MFTFMPDSFVSGNNPIVPQDHLATIPTPQLPPAPAVGAPEGVTSKFLFAITGIILVVIIFVVIKLKKK